MRKMRSHFFFINVDKLINMREIAKKHRKKVTFKNLTNYYKSQRFKSKKNLVEKREMYEKEKNQPACLL